MYLVELRIYTIQLLTTSCNVVTVNYYTNQQSILKNVEFTDNYYLTIIICVDTFFMPLVCFRRLASEVLAGGCLRDRPSVGFSPECIYLTYIYIDVTYSITCHQCGRKRLRLSIFGMIIFNGNNVYRGRTLNFGRAGSLVF